MRSLLRVTHAATLLPERGTQPTDCLCAAAAGVHLRRHNAVHPFEDATPMEFLSQKNDASLFAFGTHSKKRPHNLVFGRLFDNHILDMVETGVAGAWPPPIHPELPPPAPLPLRETHPLRQPTRAPPTRPLRQPTRALRQPTPAPLRLPAFKQMAEFPESRGGCSLESKPCIVFSGAAWEQADSSPASTRTRTLKPMHAEPEP